MGLGGGYGAPGGSPDASQEGGAWYGLTREPVDMGSGGGNGTGTGGAGGSFLKLQVARTLDLEGWYYVQ